MENKMKNIPESILNAFPFDSEIVASCTYGDGHINDTFKATSAAGTEYLVQRINTNVFTRPVELMENLIAVTAHIRKKIDDPRGCLNLIPTKDGAPYVNGPDGFWRVYDFITGTICLSQPETPADFYQSAVGFGNFQKQLSDFPAGTLHETIPNFHNTQDRYKKFKAALAADKAGRAASVQREIDFYLSEEEDGGSLVRMLNEGDLPLRVTHNDTKLNNVLLDAGTHKALCIIDLDTVMPGLSLYDFGDSIRFGASTAAEDEPDLARVWMSLELFKLYTEGFLYACGSTLTKTELELLPMGAKIMTLECGMRFLTDYLEGDTYFRIDRPQQNLDRARTHIKLVQDMERQWDDMCRVVKEAEQ